MVNPSVYRQGPRITVPQRPTGITLHPEVLLRVSNQVEVALVRSDFGNDSGIFCDSFATSRYNHLKPQTLWTYLFFKTISSHCYCRFPFRSQGFLLCCDCEVGKRLPECLFIVACQR